MSAMFERRLLVSCGRQSELGRGAGKQGSGTPGLAAAVVPPGPPTPLNAPVNDPALDAGLFSHTQSETSIAVNATTGTICAGYNDSASGLSGGGFAGFSVSRNNGVSFTDGRDLPTGAGGQSFGDPSVVWRQKDGKFYFVTISENGLGLWVSNDDCGTFTFFADVHPGGFNDDKEMMAVDNNPASAHFGRLYVAFTDFGPSPETILSTFSDDGLTWSTPVTLSPAGAEGVQGAWPAVTPSGKLFVAWSNFHADNSFDVQTASSIDGGATFTAGTAVAGAIQPFDNAATNDCGRPAVNGDIRFGSFPQVAASADNCLHLVYSAGPNSTHAGDVSDVFYKKSCDGTIWGSALKVNDDGTATDQFMASLSVGDGGVSVGWYDRRNDPANVKLDFFNRVSLDGGSSFRPSVRLSSVTAPIFIDPNLASCYHGDYDQQTQSGSKVLVLWADDRSFQDGHSDPNVFFASPSVGTSTTLGPVADAYVRDGASAGTNFGTATTLQVKNTSAVGNNRRSFLRFDVTSVSGTVTAAKLRLFGNHSAAATTLDSAFAVASNTWTETGITFNNQPALGAKQGGSVAVTSTARYYEWDVTSFVQSQKSAGVNLVSLAVTMDALTDNAPDTFNSREAASNRPQLVVTSLPSDNAPTVATAASASPNPVRSISTDLSVLGADDQGEAGLEYIWSATGTPPGAVFFSVNGINAAKHATATFTAGGTYSLRALIQEANGLSASSTVSVTVQPVLTSVAVSPGFAFVATGGTQQFTAQGLDQFGNPIALVPPVIWSVTGGGTIDSNGLFTAGSTPGGPFTVQAVSDDSFGQAQVQVVTPMVFSPVGDAYVRDGSSAGTNFGSATTLQVKRTSTVGNNRRSFVKFFLPSSLCCNIGSAKLRLFGNHSAAGTTLDSAFAVPDNSWVESAITFNNQPALGDKQGASVGITTTARYYEWDVTAWVQSQFNFSGTTISLAVTMDGLTDNAPDTFNSREAATNTPQLVVTVF